MTKGIFGETRRRSVYEMIFERLLKLGIIDAEGKILYSYMKFEASGFMPLHVDWIDADKISIAHNGIQNGDVIADPDMIVHIVPEMKMAEALTFQNDYLGIFQEVYPEPGKFYPKLKTELNSFLNSWLKRVIEDQGHVLTVTKPLYGEEDEEEEPDEEKPGEEKVEAAEPRQATLDGIEAFKGFGT